MAEIIIECISVLLTATYLVIVISFIRGWNRLKTPALAETATPETAVPETASPEATVPETAAPVTEATVPETAVPERRFSTRVSVLIAARDEEKSIGRCLEAIFSQHYPPELFEVIVIDDHSTDRTAEVVRSFQQPAVERPGPEPEPEPEPEPGRESEPEPGRESEPGPARARRPELRLIRMNEHKPINSYKKKAIAQAIQVAKGDLIVTTDADCWMGPDWLPAIVSAYEKHGYKLISSPVAFAEESSLFERLQSLEFMYLIGLGASAIGNAFPSTCNGANLAYTREVFFQVDGFKGIDDLASGDDELLLHKVAALYYNKIGFIKSRQAIVYTHAKANLREFLDQRKRWASKSIKYRNKLVVALGLAVYFFNVFLLLNGCLTLFNFNFALPLLGMFGLKLLIETVFLYFLGNFFRRLPLLIWMPVLNVLHIFYIVYIGLAGQRRSYRWKGRQVR